MAVKNLTMTCYDKQAQMHLLVMLRRLNYGETLSNGKGFRLEYRCPPQGFPHYLLISAGKPMAIVYIRAANWLEEAQEKLACALSILGFTYANTQRGYTCTPDSFEHNRLPRLFYHSREKAGDVEANEAEDFERAATNGFS